MDKIIKNKHYIVLAGCMIFGTAAILALPTHYYFITDDVSVFVVVAKNLFTGQGYTYGGQPHVWFPPVFPIAIGLFYKIIGDLYVAWLSLCIASFLLSVALLFRLGAVVYNKFVGSIAIILFTTHRLVLSSDYLCCNNQFDILLVLIALNVASGILLDGKIKYKKFILLGVILGAAILNRPENIIVSLGLLAALFTQTGLKIRRKAPAFICLALVTCSVLFPYMKFLHDHIGKWVFSTKLIALTDCEKLPEDFGVLENPCENFAKVEVGPVGYINDNWVSFLKRYRKEFADSIGQLSVNLYYGIGLLLIGLGLFRSRWLPSRKKMEILLISSLGTLIIVPLVNADPRFYLPSLPVLLLWMAKGMEEFCIFMKETFGFSKRKAVAFIAILPFLFIVRTVFYIAEERSDEFNNYYLEYKKMCLWMENNISDIGHKKIGSTHPFISNILGGIYFPTFRAGKYEEFIYTLRQAEVEYLVIDEFTMRCYPLYPDYFKDFLADESEYTELTKIYSIKSPGKIVLYKVK